MMMMIIIIIIIIINISKVYIKLFKFAIIILNVNSDYSQKSTYFSIFEHLHYFLYPLFLNLRH